MLSTFFYQNFFFRNRYFSKLKNWKGKRLLNRKFTSICSFFFYLLLETKKKKSFIYKNNWQILGYYKEIVIIIGSQHGLNANKQKYNELRFMLKIFSQMVCFHYGAIPYHPHQRVTWNGQIYNLWRPRVSPMILVLTLSCLIPVDL